MSNLTIKEILSDDLTQQEKQKYKFVSLSDLEKARKRLIVKSNELVNNTKFKQNADAYKLLDVIFSFISKDDNKFKSDKKGKFAFNTKEYFRLIGINEKTSESYNYLADIIKGISSFSLKTKNNNYVIINMLSDDKAAYIDTNNGICYINLNKKIIKYLYYINTMNNNAKNLESHNTETKSHNTETKSHNTETKSHNKKSGNFTIYELRERLNFKSKYSYRLHEILKSNLFKKELNIQLDELRNLLNIEEGKYKLNADFKRKIIDPALADINKYTNIKAEYSDIIGGKKRIVGYKFNIKKENQSEYMPRINRINKELDKNYKER